MIDYIWLLMSAFIGFLISAYFCRREENARLARIARDVTVAFFITFLFSAIMKIDQRLKNEEIVELKKEKMLLIGRIDGITKSLLVSINQSRENVFSGNFSLTPRNPGDWKKNLMRGVPTKDNAFYVDLGNIMQPVEQGAIFYITANKVNKQGDNKVAKACNIPVYRTGITELPFGNYIYKMAVSPINLGNNSIHLEISRELNFDYLMNLTSYDASKRLNSDETEFWKNICK